MEDYMTAEEIRKKVAELKAQGVREEVIIYNWANKVNDGSLTPDQFAGLMFAVGFQMPKDFSTLSEEEKKAWIVKGLNQE